MAGAPNEDGGPRDGGPRDGGPRGGGPRGGGGGFGGGYLWFGVTPTPPLVLPGEYRVRLTLPGQTLDQLFTVRLDPRSKATLEQLRAQHDTLERLLAAEQRISTALMQIGTITDQITAIAKVVPDRALADQGQQLAGDLQKLAARLRNQEGEYRAPAQVRENLAQLYVMISQYDGPPTQAQAEWLDKFEQQSATVLADLDKIFHERLAAFNAGLRNVGIPAPVSAGKE
jgi:hypothetical protein